MTEVADWTTDGIDEGAEVGNSWIKFALGGLAILSAIVLLLFAATRGNSQYMLTVEEIHARSDEMVGKDARISGIVVPESIEYDAATLHLEFDIVDASVSDQEPLRIVIDGEPLPDQMKDQAEAVVEGRLESDGTFRAESLMMKCASKYETEAEG